MRLDSSYTKLCRIKLPYHGRQLCMARFDVADPVLPEGFADYQPVVWRLTRAAGKIHGTAYLTVDEKWVEAGNSQRQPHPHIDGYYREAAGSWGSGPGPGGWSSAQEPFWQIIVASDVAGCRAWRGVFDGVPKRHGDLRSIADQLDDGEVLEGGWGYLFSPACVHESMVFDKPTRRTFMRIALKP